MGDSPQLLPISAILSQAGPGVHTGALDDAALNARAAALNARAAQLRGPVLPAAERARLLASEQGLR
jgi:predicted glycosyltransferase